MNHTTNTALLSNAAQYTEELLTELLPDALFFHRLGHTVNVVEAVKLLAKAERVTAQQCEWLQLAAWFHDTGYTVTYDGHEAVSQEIAEGFLSDCHYPTAQIAIIRQIIAATEINTQPTNLLEQIIKDADIFHLSQPNYSYWQDLLRVEWETALGKYYTPQDWKKMNLNFLLKHQYFTSYGKHILEVNKALNIKACQLNKCLTSNSC